MQLPLTEKGYIANSIAKFVLDHPEEKDILKAYNKWVVQERFMNYSLGQADTVVFCLDIFDTCINGISPELLREIYINEMLCLQETYL
jgi:hypothetical protein